MVTIKDLYATALALLFFCAFGFVSDSDYREQIKAEEHAKWLADKYERQHGPGMHKEIRQLRMDVEFAELQEKYRKARK